MGIDDTPPHQPVNDGHTWGLIYLLVRVSLQGLLIACVSWFAAQPTDRLLTDASRDRQ